MELICLKDLDSHLRMNHQINIDVIRQHQEIFCLYQADSMLPVSQHADIRVVSMVPDIDPAFDKLLKHPLCMVSRCIIRNDHLIGLVFLTGD